MGGAGAWAGTGAGNAEKYPPPQAIEWGGAGKKAGGPRFLGSRPPHNELYLYRVIVWNPSADDPDSTAQYSLTKQNP